MREAISIEGTLLMLDDSTPHVAVPVQAIRDGKVIATTLSDDGGRYQFVNLKPGQYQVRCQVLGGHVYYGEEKAGKPEGQKAGGRGSEEAGERVSEEAGEETQDESASPSLTHSPTYPLTDFSSLGDTLRVEAGKTLKDIDFRFARFKKGTWRTYTYLDGLAGNCILGFYCEPDGVMWFGTLTGGVSRYDGKEFVNLTTKDGLANNRVDAIHGDPDGVMWFGTHAGVSRYDGRGMGDFPHFVNFTTEDGLVDNGVHAVYCDPNGVMWFGTEGGVSGYDGAVWTSLDTRDGLPGNNVSSIVQDPDGLLWFGTEGGITRYRRSTTPPKAYIASVTTDQIYRGVSAIPAFTPGTRVTIEYSSIDFKTLPEKRQYRCRVYEARGDEGNEHAPSSPRSPAPPYLSSTKETSFDWTPKKPGTYVFEVQAIDRDLNYSEPASVKLQVVTDPRNHRIAQLEGELAERERAEMERMQQELEDARQIHRSLLPKGPPRMAGYEIAGTSLPAKEVSGDFYDYLSLGRDVGVVLADVTGKSVKAAMIAAMANGMLHAEVRERKDVWDSPRMILGQLNIGLRPRLIRGMFTAMSLGVLQVAEKRLIFSNAGMMYPIVKRGKEAWELEVSGMPLGITDRAEYQDLSFDMEEGDFVVFYSDGVTEATNETGEMYQTERLLGLIQQADPGLSAHEMVDLIVRDVTAYVGGEEASDDITIVVIRCKE